MSSKNADETKNLASLGEKYGFSVGAVESALAALQRTGGSSAQFSNPEMGGSVQWMRGGMTQIGDMFNGALKDRVAGLCSELSSQLDSLAASDSSKDGAKDESASSAPKPDTASEYPREWGNPSSAGGQNGVRYAFFPSVRRLAVEENGKKTVYDTKDHHINGVSQQQGSHSRLAFSTSDGPVDVSSLEVVQPDKA